MSQDEVETPESHGEWKMLEFSVMLAKLYGWNQTAVSPLMTYNYVTMTSSMTIHQDDVNNKVINDSDDDNVGVNKGYSV